MQISNILSSITDTLSLGKKSEETAATAAKAETAADGVTTATSSRKALAEILKKYDVTDITPEAFSRLLAELHQAGAITEKELQELSAVRLDLENAGVDADEPVNLVEFYNDKILELQRRSEASGGSQRQLLAPLVDRLGWIEKFSTIHANPEAVGMDLAA